MKAKIVGTKVSISLENMEAKGVRYLGTIQDLDLVHPLIALLDRLNAAAEDQLFLEVDRIDREVAQMGLKIDFLDGTQHVIKRISHWTGNTLAVEI